MSLKSLSTLEVTGSLMEVPPPKDPTPIRASIDKSKIKPFALENRRRSLIQVNRSVNVSRAVLSRDSNSAETKKNEHNAKICQDETFKLTRRVDELEQQLKASQKSNKEKEKTINEMKKNIECLSKKETALNERVVDLEHLNKALRYDLVDLEEQQRRTDERHRAECERIADEMSRVRMEKEDELKSLRSDHASEIRVRDEKLEGLKKQIAGVFKDNSWERQMQIDELTRELKKAQEEYEEVRQKLKAVGKSSKKEGYCENCENLQGRGGTSQEKDSLIAELAGLVRAYQSNGGSVPDELWSRLTQDRTHSELLQKLNINLSSKASLAKINNSKLKR